MGFGPQKWGRTSISTSSYMRDRQLRFHLDSGREHPPRDMSSPENRHCYNEIDAIGQRYRAVLSPTGKHQDVMKRVLRESYGIEAGDYISIHDRNTLPMTFSEDAKRKSVQPEGSCY
eukprot:gene12738-biopygen3463